jgi:hypothetical protein
MGIVACSLAKCLVHRAPTPPIVARGTRVKMGRTPTASMQEEWDMRAHGARPLGVVRKVPVSAWDRISGEYTKVP